jgi:CRP/FNR family transcriptional regulator, cyclic AMP receptor protein
VPHRSRSIVSTDKGDFDLRKFPATVGDGLQVLSFAKTQTIFAQGDVADAIFYVQEGRVRLTVVSRDGKEATIGILNAGNFCGEGALAGQSLRMDTATAMTGCVLLRIIKKSMMRALQQQPFSDMFLTYRLKRNIRYEADLIDQLFNSSERRLARLLLLLARFGEEGAQTSIPKISQGVLAEMIGTTRSRVSFFMNRFRGMGLVEYGENGIQVHSSLLNVVLHDCRKLYNTGTHVTQPSVVEFLCRAIGRT